MNEWYDAEQRVERAQELFSQQKWQEALDELRAAIAINPFNSAYHFNAGLTLDEMQRFDEAIEEYRHALKIEPTDIDALHRIAGDQFRTNRHRDAIASLAQIEAIDAAYEPCYCGRILPYVRLGDHEKAEEMFYLARQYKDECPQCYYGVAESLFERRLYDKAIFCWQKTLDLDETFPDVHLRIARAFREKGELEKARHHFQQEWRQSPRNIEALLELGDLLLQMDRTEEAGEKFRRAIELSPDNPTVHIAYGRWLIACDRLDAARESIARALTMRPLVAEAHLHLAEICLREGDAPRARRHLRNELRLRPTRPRLLLDLANLFIDCGHNRAAVACLRRLTELDPLHAGAWQNLAVAYFGLGHYDQGIDACHKALAVSPRLAPAMYNLALAHRRRGQYDHAMAWLRKAAVVDPADPALQWLEFCVRMLIGWDWFKINLRKLMFWRA